MAPKNSFSNIKKISSSSRTTSFHPQPVGSPLGLTCIFLKSLIKVVDVVLVFELFSLFSVGFVPFYSILLPFARNKEENLGKKGCVL